MHISVLLLTALLATTTTTLAAVRHNITFKPLDPDLTPPSQFWMPLWNTVPQDYCTFPRYPIVPTPGPIAMDVLHELIPNGTVPQVRAKPTNVWQKNLWGFNWTAQNVGENWNAIYPYPYILTPKTNNIVSMYTGRPQNETLNRQMQVQFAYPDPVPKDHPAIHNASYPYMVMSAAYDFTLQIMNGNYPRLAELNDLGAVIDYREHKSDNSTVAKLYMLKGAPLVTVECNNAKLGFGNLDWSPPILQVNGMNPGNSITGKKFSFHTAQGPAHPAGRMWHVYFSSDVTIHFESPTSVLPLKDAFTGTVQWGCGDYDDAMKPLLDKAAGTYARRARIEYDMDDSKHQAKVRFVWDKQGKGPLIMLGLAHHVKLLPKSVPKSMTTYWMVKGNMTAVVADVWEMTYNVTNIGFGEELEVDPKMKTYLRASAMKDYELRINMCPGDNATYGYPGHRNMELYAYVRDLAQYTDIAVVLENLGERDLAVKLTKKVLECMSWVLRMPVRAPYACPPPINGSNPPQCVRDMMNVYFDENWGGLITGWFDRFAKGYCQCDKSTTDPYACRGYNYCDNPRGWDGFANYGNAFYNDHHFQYGYIIKSLAWAVYFQETKNAHLGLNKTAIHNITKQALAFARDVANPDDVKDKYFTKNRHKDVFDGHSWAEGYDYSGRILTWVNQQSGGEAVNAYYAVYLLGKALNDTNIGDWGLINLAMEAVSVDQYQHLSNVTKDKIDQPDPIVNKWGKCWSILIGNGGSAATYYGPNALFQCGITFLPVTPLTRQWVDPEWTVEAMEWIKYKNNLTGMCVFYDPLTMSENPCPGQFGPQWTGNEWGCCPTNVNYTNNQWRAYPEWFPYMYVLEAFTHPQWAFEHLEYKNLSMPTKSLPFPYIANGRTVGYQQDLTQTAAIYHVATWNRTKWH